MPVLDPERHRAPAPSEDWLKETREREESREDLLAVLDYAVRGLLDTTYSGPSAAHSRRYLAQLKRSARRLARGEAYAERERVFRRLAEWWRSETGLMSSIDDKALHPAYQQIIGMGPEAILLILRELQLRPAHWFWALNAITREDPINPEDIGNVKKMTEAWLRWGRERGYLDDDVVRRRFPESA